MIRCPRIIGWPGAVTDLHGGPKGTAMADHIIRTMPVAFITPSIQQTSAGMEIYTVAPDFGTYSTYMTEQGVNVSGCIGGKLTLIYQELGPMGETYTNSYSASSILGGLTEGISGVAQELLFASGKSGQQLLDAGAASDNKLISGAAGGANKVLDALESGAGKMFNEKVAHQLRTALVNGEKIDFPMMWKGSNWSAEYSFTVRLYNPQPANQEYHDTLIVAPLAALSALAMPRTSGESNLTYQWPFLVKLKIPGYVHLDAGYIRDLTILKGGDVNDRAWNNRPSIVDIRLTIAPLYSTALLALGDTVGEQPTLKKEIDNLRLEKNSENDSISFVDYDPALLAVSDPASSPAQLITENMASTPVIAPPAGRGNLSDAQSAAAENMG
jgi:hypothetical protein